jgi:HPt (histidine-containing phosphotransfer) domain-containing protein
MAVQGYGPATFDKPGGEGCMAPRTRPIDLAHLGRQTMDDRALSQELLGLFLHQSNTTVEQIFRADRSDRLRLAHALKGAARAVGAFPIADCLAQIEDQPDQESGLKRLKRLVGEAQEFIASISR